MSTAFDCDDTALAPMTRLEELVITAASDPRLNRVLGDVLHQIANAVQEAIGVCGQLRQDAQLTPELVTQLDAALERAVTALRRLQAPTAERDGKALHAADAARGTEEPPGRSRVELACPMPARRFRSRCAGHVRQR